VSQWWGAYEREGRMESITIIALVFSSIACLLNVHVYMMRWYTGYGNIMRNPHKIRSTIEWFKNRNKRFVTFRFDKPDIWGFTGVSFYVGKEENPHEKYLEIIREFD
jgi:hypothetical protein